jgi:hypothetical protein
VCSLRTRHLDSNNRAVYLTNSTLTKGSITLRTAREALYNLKVEVVVEVKEGNNASSVDELVARALSIPMRRGRERTTTTVVIARSRESHHIVITDSVNTY